jgi:CRP/FNR family transcriptional regulator, cyclic AMP receptor protein
VLRKDAKVELMRRVPLFSGCSKKELAQIASVADELSFAPGRTLIEQGRRGREFIVVLDGKVEVRQNGKKLPTRGGDTFFGELALLTDAPRSATVTTTTPVRALVITDQAFRRLLEEAPSIQAKVLQSLAERLAPDVI